MNQNKWDQRFSGVDPMSWREEEVRQECQDGDTPVTEDDRGEEALCVHLHTWLHDIVGLSVG